MRVSLLFILCFMISLTSSYARGGFGPGPGGTGDASVNLVKFESEHFAGSGNCAKCHSNLKDDDGNDVSMDSHWRSSMMANAARDPFWQAKVASEVKRNPEFKYVIEEKCSHCHTPMAERQSFFDTGGPEDTKLLDDGFLNEENEYHVMGIDGVSCAICHQIQNTPDLGTEDSFTGHFTIDEDTAKPNRIVYGPFNNVFAHTMKRDVGYIPAGSSHLASSKVCATCHMLNTPTVDDEGNVVGEITEQAPYMEWEHSVYGDESNAEFKSCQNCHMPLVASPSRITNQPKGRRVERKYPIYEHNFVGGNASMVNLIKENKEVIGATATDEQFDDTINRTKDLLQNHTAKISLGEVSLSGDILNIPISVEMLSGHKFPTGFPFKSSWIHLRVSADDGTVIFESGEILPDGCIDDDNACNDLATFEPHYNVIDSDEQVQIYQSIMADVNDMPTYTLLRGAYYIKDNRLLPKGFTKENAVNEIGVFGQAINDTDFVGGGDKITYKVDTSSFNGNLKIEANLRYKSISYPSYQDLIKDIDLNLVKQFSDFYEQLDMYKDGVLISSTSMLYQK